MKRIMGIFPKSGEELLKDALGQFKGIIAQINEGIKKVKTKVAKNDKKAAKIIVENERLSVAVVEAQNAATNLEALLSGQLVVTAEAEVEDKDELSGPSTEEEVTEETSE